MYRKAVVKSYDRENHSATVQIVGSLAVWLPDVPVSQAIPPDDVLPGRFVSVLSLDPNNPADMIITSLWGGVPAPFSLASSAWGIIQDFRDFTTATTGGGSTFNSFKDATLSTVNVNNTSTARIYMAWLPNPWLNTKRIAFHIALTRGFSYSDVNNYCWITIRLATTAANPTANAIGWRIDDGALKGLVYEGGGGGAGLEITDLSTSMTTNQEYMLSVVFTPGTGVEWFVNGVSKGSTETEPSTTIANPNISFTASAIANGGFGGEVFIMTRWAYDVEV